MADAKHTPGQYSGRYTVSAHDGFAAPGKWTVWDSVATVRISEHDSEREAKAAVKRYLAADKRRERAKGAA